MIHSLLGIHVFFISNTSLKLVKNESNAKQHPKTELYLFENYLHSLSTLSSKNKWIYSKKEAKKQTRLYSRDYTITHNEIKMKMKKGLIDTT